MPKKIRVFLIDDSAIVRTTVTELLASDPEIEVTGSAADPIFGAEKMRRNPPDVLILDVEMPRMDGLTFLKQIMAQNPLPVIMCSSWTERGAEATLQALELGAVDIITKPKVGTSAFLHEAAELLRHAVKAAAAARVKRRAGPMEVPPKLTADAMMARPVRPLDGVTERIAVLGASTGGTEALRTVLTALTPRVPGIVIVQHMPEGFTRAFGQRLNRECAIEVREAADRDRVTPGLALIAPGNRHMLLKRSGSGYYIEIKEGPLVNRHRPSVDVLFRSAARYAGKNAIGVVMTGMGDDGARGLLEMKTAGAATIAQDEETSVVFGMPKEAIRLGAADRILPLRAIAGALESAC